MESISNKSNIEKINLKVITISTFVWMISEIITMSYVNELLLNGCTNELFLKTARISAYATIIIKSILIPAFVVIIFYFTFFLSIVFSYQYDKKYILSALNNFIICCSFFVFLRFLNAYIYLEGNIYYPDSENFELFINNSIWYKIQSYLDAAYISISYLIFIFSLMWRKNITLYDSFKLSLGLLSVILIYNYKFIVQSL